MDVFISYSRKDSAIVQEFAKHITAAGFSVWMDIDGIESGDEFKRKIASAIRGSKVFLYFSSVSSNESEWTVKEVNYAIKKKIHIIPIKLDKADYNESVDFDLCGVDFIQCNGSKDIPDAVGKLLRSLKNRIGDGTLEGKDDVVKEQKKIDSENEGNYDKLPSNFWESVITKSSSILFKFGCGVSLLFFVLLAIGFCSDDKEEAEQERIEKILSIPRSSKGLLCVAAIDKSCSKTEYFTAEEWESLPPDVMTNYAQVGVLVSDDGHEFIIAPTDCENPVDDEYEFQFGCYGVEFDGVRQYKDISEFITTGYSDTKKIVEQAKGKIDSDRRIKGAPAAEAAWSYKANGYDNLQWYLPSVSELKMICENKDAINDFIDKYIPQGGQIRNEWYWSSTVYYNTGSWYVTMNYGISYGINYRYNGSGRVRAVAVAK